MTIVEEEALLRRITSDPEMLGGKPIIRGKRLAVEHVLGDLAAGETPDSIVDAYPFLERDDVTACLLYAQRAVRAVSAVPAVTLERATAGR